MKTEIKYEERIVLFLDILGFKSLVNESQKSEVAFNKISEALNKLNNYQDRFGKIPQREITSFSDSIVISYLLDNSVLLRIIHEISNLVVILLGYDMLCRGGIGFGELYHNGSIVYGPAMVKAYELESKIANYPRIIIDEVDYLKYISICSFKDCEHYIMKDNDGVRYINIFNFYYSENDILSFESSILKDKMKELIEKNITNTDERVREKYKWLLRKLNEGLKTKVYFIPVKK